MLKYKILFSVLILLVLTVPVVSKAAEGWKGLVTCGKSSEIETVDGKSSIKGACDFKALMGLVNRLVNFILISLAVPIAAIMFAYAGAKMIISGGESSGARETAKNVFTNAVRGLVLVAGAWLIIHTLLAILGYEASWIGF